MGEREEKDTKHMLLKWLNVQPLSLHATEGFFRPREGKEIAVFPCELS